MGVKAVIFDMDGVLLDSMRYHVMAWQKTFKPKGLFISDHEVYAREGESWQKSTKDFLIMAGYKSSRALIKEVFMERSRIFKRIFKPRIFSGAKSLLGFFDRKDIKLGLVTATPRREVARMLPLPMLRLFDATICGGDTKKGKPHPEPYLKALKALKVKAKEAIVIENAPYGIRSCKLAGICCIAVATSLPKRYLRGADVVLNSLHDVNDYFKKRGHKRDE